MPKFAEITVLIDGNTVTEQHNVIWKSVDRYHVPTATELQAGANTTVKALAWIGDPIYGYIPHETTFTLEQERIVNYTKPTKVSINPYLDTMTQLNEELGLTDGKLIVETNLGRTLALEVKFDEVNFDYRGATDVSFPLHVGITVDFGGVESIIDANGLPVHSIVGGRKVIEVRQELPQLLDIKERIAAGIKTWYGSSDFTGSIYEPIDFASIGTCSVVALSKRGINSGILTTDIAGFNDAVSGARALDSTLWPAETVEWDALVSATRLQGSIVAVYYNETTTTYYVFYRGAIDLEDTNYLNGALDAGYTFQDVVSTDGITRKHAYKDLDGGEVLIVDVAQFEEGITVTFESGAEEKYNITWGGTDIRYTFLGGKYYVQAELYKGHPTLQQIFDVPVNVAPSKLESLEIASPLASDSSVVVEDGKIVSILVDPYEGFKSLPHRAIAIFEGGEHKLEIDIDWNITKILNAMTTAGGEFNRDNNKEV